MGKTQNYLALDLGAESGRAILGRFDGNRIELNEVHRFPNGGVGMLLKSGGVSLHWDILRLWTEIKNGISYVSRKMGEPLEGIGLDTWGVDFGLLDRNGSLVANPYCYRDSRTDGMLEEAFRRMPREQIFEHTGIQFMQLNTLYQLLAMAVQHAPELEIAETFLTMPDIFNYWLTGQMVCEFTIATTTQFYDPRKRDWSEPLLAAMGIPRKLFPPVIKSGTVLGKLIPTLADEVGAQMNVVAPACHDTGSAVGAVPAGDDGFVWISSGTWSIIGTNVNEPVINQKSLEYNFTNEGAADGGFRLCKNIAGLWLVQECRRTWALAGEEYSYTDLTAMAAEAKPLVSFLDPDDKEFLRPGNMPTRIREYCKRTGQKIPETKGEIVRCALQGVAFKYRYVLECLENMVEHPLEPIHIVGGGTQNLLLNQLTADATGKRVVTGPIEATAMGNIIAQAVALGHISSFQQGRDIVCASCELKSFEPVETKRWDDAYGRFKRLLEG
ncbi:MAG: rhamnulokinase family protein [Chloroflexota bacterium]